jgi:hypothetical protein
MNNRIHELEQNLIEIHQRIEKIQTEIRSYQQISTEHLTENGAIKMYENLPIKYLLPQILF